LIQAASLGGMLRSAVRPDRARRNPGSGKQPCSR